MKRKVSKKKKAPFQLISSRNSHRNDKQNRILNRF